MKYLIIFFISLFLVGVFLATIAKIYTGDPFRVFLTAEAPLAIIASCMPSMIFFMRKKLFPSVGRSYLTRGFSFLFVVILYVLAIDKYSFIFPDDTWIFSLHPVEPVTVTVSVLLILHGVAWYVKAEKKTSLSINYETR